MLTPIIVNGITTTNENQNENQNENEYIKRQGLRKRKRQYHFHRSKIFVFSLYYYYCYCGMVDIKMISFHRSSSSSSSSSSSKTIARLFCSAWSMSSSPQRPRQHQQQQHRLRQKSSLINVRRTNNFRHHWHHSSSTSSTTTTKLLMAKTNNANKNNDKLALGDLVYIIPKNGGTTTTTQTGEIESIRGSGWYSIRIDDNNNNNNNKDNIIKCRGSQIQRLENSDATERTGSSSNDNIRKITTTNNNNNNLRLGIPSSLETIDNNNDNGMEDVNSFAAETISEVSQLPPIIYDLDAAILKMKTGGYSDLIEETVIQQAAHHATYKKWVVFTDLHCSPTTLDTCLEVLHIVHETAMKQTEKCGILFLGDFWHHRGTLRVDCLNAILNEFRSWQVPMIMIPGNHDQVTLGGQNHGLTSLENSYRVVGPGGDDVPGPLILSHPAIFQNALFVPHVRDMDIMKSIVQSNKAKESSALFVHTEVKGALMNDMIVSTNGISPSVFPPQKNIYSGHFHKPHFVETSSSSSSSSTIEYIGSPYQVSLSEAQQEKQLVVLDADLGWRCEQRIPICVGRCHFKSSSLKELQQYRLITGHEENESANVAAADGTIRVKKGDRIVMNIPKKEQRGLVVTSDDTALKSQIQLLRDQGVVVEVREVSSSNDNLSSPTMLPNDSVEDMSPVSTWRAYLKDAEIRNEFANENDHDSLLEIGLKILEEIESKGGVQNRGVQHDLRLTSTSATGFGPFEDAITYPLENRGLVLLRGSNSDSGPDSNGTGKSSLAMATLWALTGCLDSRPASASSKVADVINDNSKVAHVTVEGFINDLPFVISRTKGTSKSDLVFHVDNVDLTTQSTKETQALVEEKLGVDAHILTRVAFYGQHGMNDLLEATDTKLKDELSLVVPLDLWQQANSIARLKSRQAKKKVDEFEGMIRLRKSDVDTLSNRVSRAKESRDYKQKHLLESKERLNNELKRIQNLLDQTIDESSNVEMLQAELKGVSSNIHDLNDRYDSIMADKDSEVNPLREELSQVQDIMVSATRINSASEMNVLSCKMSLDSARASISKIQEKWSLDLSHGIPSVLKPPEECPTCLQTLLSDGSDNSLENAQKMMEVEIKEGHSNLHSAEHAFEEASSKASECSNTLVAQKKILHELQSDLEILSTRWSGKFLSLQDKLKEKRQIQNNLTSQLSMVVKDSQLIAQSEAVKASFNEEKINAAHANEVYESLDVELSSAMDFLKQIGLEQEEEENNQSILSTVGERFGQRGVQTYVLQNTVESLERASQNYLDHLSDGSQRLELSLDAGDKIVRNAFVRGPGGEFKHRPLSTLSGGQWRRCSLSLSFAFAELVASKGRLRSSLLVLDEPLTHLDRSGRTKFGELVRKMLSTNQDVHQEMSGIKISTAVLILQDLSAEELEEAFDGIDTVIRKDGKSYLRLDEEIGSSI